MNFENKFVDSFSYLKLAMALLNDDDHELTSQSQVFYIFEWASNNHFLKVRLTLHSFAD